MHEHAQNGVKKLYIAEILSMIGILGIIPILGIPFAICSLVGYVIRLVGLNEAGKDDPGYQIAFKIAIGTMLFNLLKSFVNVGVLSTLVSTAETGLKLALTWMVISTGCRLLLDRAEYDLAQAGQKCWKTYVLATLISFGASALVNVFQAGVLAFLLACVSAVMQLIAYFRYFGFLKKSWSRL